MDNTYITKLFSESENRIRQLREVCDSIDIVRIEEEKRRSRELQQLLSENKEDEALLSRLEAESASLTSKLESAQQKLQDMKKKGHGDYSKVKEAFEKSEKKLALSQAKYEKRKMMNEGIQAFLERYGIQLGLVDKGSIREEFGKNLHSIVFSKIHPFEEKQYLLYFSTLSSRFDKFHVERAQPDFPEFKQLATDSNKSQDLAYLIKSARIYWIKRAVVK